MEVDDMLFDSDSENLPPTPTPVQPTPPAMQPPAPVMQAATSTSALASATPTAAVLLPIPTPRIQTHPTSSLALPIPSETSATQNSLPVPSSSSQSTGSGLWATTWVPIPGRYRAVFQSEDFVKSIFETASSNRAPSTLVISGRNIPELSMCLVTKCKEAAARRDFSEIMAADQVYNLLNDDGSLLSTGVGIGREAIWTAFYCYVQHGGQWFLTRFEGKCSVATTMPLASSGLVNADRRINLMVLGCLAALLLIHGIAPEPLSPCLIQWAANQCDVRSLTREFIGEWHPELKALLDRWISAGPAGDIRSFAQHFATFHDIQASQKLISRDLAQHEALGIDMLYTSVIGPQPPTHTELMEFVTGFRLPCSNGFDFGQVLCSDPSGSAGFISKTWTSVIHDFGSIEPYLIMFTPSRSAIRQFVESATNPILAMDLPSMLQNFLQTSGVPCSAELDEGKARFSKLIPYNEVDSPAFRPKCFCWSSTGSPHIDFDEHQKLVVHFVGPDDEGYHNDEATRRSLMKQGVIAFRACFRTVRIPIIFLAELCSRSYPAQDEGGNDIWPFTVEQAIENWLFLQTLNGIGAHTIL
ncbi:hypothetical protein K438DRAFT_2074346 [Mycena galopus ATCC 62051]|nr:hypothetical protein K438DRAFT_2074346 [Mycena galopus ATCC 62051]